VAAYAKVIARAWQEPAFKALLLADAAAALAAAGHPVPAGMTVKVVEGTAKVLYFILPLAPTRTELVDEVLEKAATGTVCRHIVNVGPQP
jgi:hypothetical protein